MKKTFTLCMICKDGQILLGMKKRGFGEGKWNGFGGKVEEGETIEAAAKREVEEEVGINAQTLTSAGVLNFSFEEDPKLLEVHVFSIRDFDGVPTETEEMRPQWFSYALIPYDDMWADDRYWLPLLLEGKTFKGAFHFDRPSSLEHSARIITKELTSDA